jgi:hypothetical protein
MKHSNGTKNNQKHLKFFLKLACSNTFTPHQQSQHEVTELASWNFNFISWTNLRCEPADQVANPQLDTVTLQPAPSDTVMICPMWCCGLATQLQIYISLRIICPGCFHWGLIVTVTVCPAQAILIVTIRLTSRWDTTAACEDVRMRWPNLTRCMVDPTQKDTTDPCVGGALLGGSRHIWG